MSDLLDDILKGIPAPAETPPATVQTDEHQGETKSAMNYSPDFEKAYGKKSS
ncbi:MAG: hypothetical protein KKB59_14155 [Spirochaetes bacterium]|nr:hypothetical protein [Spirochaetota bacterium]